MQLLVWKALPSPPLSFEIDVFAPASPRLSCPERTCSQHSLLARQSGGQGRWLTSTVEATMIISLKAGWPGLLAKVTMALEPKRCCPQPPLPRNEKVAATLGSSALVQKPPWRLQAGPTIPPSMEAPLLPQRFSSSPSPFAPIAKAAARKLTARRFKNRYPRSNLEEDMTLPRVEAGKVFPSTQGGSCNPTTSRWTRRAYCSIAEVVSPAIGFTIDVLARYT